MFYFLGTEMEIKFSEVAQAELKLVSFVFCVRAYPLAAS